MISGFVWGQYPNIKELTGGFTFAGETLEEHTQVFSATTSSCAFNFSNTYRYYSFKANFDMVFAFDLIATKPDFRFLVWKLPVGSAPNSIFTSNTTTVPNRTIEGTFNVKGMKEGDVHSCEGYSTTGANGYAKAFEGTEILKKDETVVIAVYGGSNTEPFDIKVNVAKEGGLEYKNLCINESYKLIDIKDDIKTDIVTKFGDNTINVDYIKFFNANFDTEKTSDVSSVVNGVTQINQTYYAQVRDGSGNLKYIYKLTFYFRPPIDFNEFFVNGNSQLRNITTCKTIFEWKGKNWYLNTYLNLPNPSDYDILYINYIDKDGVAQTISDPENIHNIQIATNGILMLNVRVKSINPLKCDNEVDIVQSIKNESITLEPKYEMSFCEGSIFTYEDLLNKMFPLGHAGYTLETTITNGTPLNFGSNSQLSYKIKVKYGAGVCLTNEVDLILNKTSPANITNTSINGICLSDFSQTDVDNTIHIIQNAHSYKLRFYQADGLTEMAEADLFNYIKTNETGKIIVKALATDNSNTICDTQVELKFNLDQSSFALINNIPTLNSTCSEVGAGHTFTVTEIETYLKAQLGRNDVTFSGITEQVLTDNASTTLRFRVQVNGEACWSEEMELKLQVITKPNVPNASKDLYADCDDKITINVDMVKELFGASSVTDYNYNILHNSSTPLVFVGGEAIVKIRFENKLSSTCFVEKEIVVIEKQDLVVDVGTLETYNQTNEIVYCEDDSNGAKAQIQANLDYIKSHYPTLVSRSSVDEIFAQFNSDKGDVEIVFEDPNYCGAVSIKFFYQRNDLPIFDIPVSGEICSDTKYTLDFEQLAKEKGLDVNDYTFAITGGEIHQASAFVYELGVGNYTVTIRDKKSGCPKAFSLQLTSSAAPTIDKITINEKSIVVSVKGNGKLEYALFDSVGRIIVDWQTKNELIIPDNITDNNFTVKVRLNNCGVSERKDVIYLFLPNVVTPNQDGKNDIWQPMTKNGKVNDTSNSYKLIIFDRSGKQILNKEGIDIIKWDGTLNGNPVADGTYWYMLEFSKQSDDLKVLYSGSILVKRKIK